MTTAAVAAPANSVDMPATEKYPETPAKEVAAKNVAALATRAPEYGVETVTCPVVRAADSDAIDRRLVHWRPPYGLGSGATGGRSTAAIVVGVMVASIVDRVVAVLVASVVAIWSVRWSP
jgi:hypothetical protein